ncbi:MAG: DUF6383 domain-containing protein [Parabacteroides gordonii]|uniref:DUF6383 domain-containing protein n=1 Tax=Parabacteroides gordonii TaxID=574930 RepID=UPI003A899E8E
MNKKFSTLLAAFLAAGYSMTAEAGVVKILTPKDGNQYVIAGENWAAAQTAPWLKVNGSSLEGVVAANTTSPTLTGALWTISINPEGKYTLSQTVGGQTAYASQNPFADGEAILTAGPNPTQWVIAPDYATAKKTKFAVSSGGKELTVPTTAAATTMVNTGGGTDLAFFAQTTPLATNAAPQNVKIAGKYLVYNPGKNAVELVDQKTFDALNAIYPDCAAWTVEAGGKLQNVNQKGESNKQLVIADDGALSLGSAGSAFEQNTAEGPQNKGMVIAWASGVASYLVSDATDSKVKLVTDIIANQTQLSSIELTESTTVGSAITLDGYDFAASSFLTDGGYYLLSGTTATSNTNQGFLTCDAANNNLTVVATGSETISAYWKASKVAGTSDIYTFANEANPSVPLAISGYTRFKVVGTSRGFELLAGDNFDKKVEYLTSGTPKFTVPSGANTPANVMTFGAYAAKLNMFNVGTLINKQGSSFSLLLKDAATGESTLSGNVFAGNLVPVQIVYAADGVTATGFKKATTTAEKAENSYLLQRESDGQIIVLDLKDKWSVAGIDQHVTAGGYKFATLTASNMIKYLNGELSGSRNLAYTFDIEYSRAYSDPITAPIKYIAVTKFNAVVPNVKYYLATYESNGTTYLTVNTETINTVAASFDNQTIVHGKDSKNNPLLYRYVNISFANHASVKYENEEGNLVGLNGKVLAVDKFNQLRPMTTVKNLAEKPEGQWAVLMNDYTEVNANRVVKNRDGNNTNFIFRNRENGKELNAQLLYTLGDNTYAVEYVSASAKFAKNAEGAALTRDTLVITAAPELTFDRVEMDGYANYTAENVKDQEYRLIVASTDDVNYYVTENHNSSHLLGLTKDVEYAANWRLVPMTAKRTLDVNGYLKTPTDSVYTMNYSQYFDSSINGYRQVNDTLAIVSYALQNVTTREYLTYKKDMDITSMICKEKSEDYTTDDLNQAYRFVMKEKDNGLVNLMGVSLKEDAEYYTIDLNKKLYGATTQKSGAVEVEKAYAQINSNDLFKVAPVDAKEYRKMVQGDTIRIFRDENDYDVMYENGEFLNLGNKAQLTDMKPALYVDTVYVNRGTNNRYQYLLAVNVTRVDARFDNADHMLSPDTTFGRFMVNLVDTAVYAYKNGAIHSNKYINEDEAGENCVKTGFVWGFRTGDKLYVTKDNTFKKDDARVIDLSTSDFNVAKFAFQFVNPSSSSDKSFKIQTRFVDYDSAITVKDQKDRAESNDGYLKTINGVVVVTKGYSKGEKFDLTAEHSIPTANEDLNASEVSVIAKEGAVVINGAAGKKVVITNVLGQTIASTVLSSDNATISAPAGVVVVAVEGEAAVKAIVK